MSTEIFSKNLVLSHNFFILPTPEPGANYQEILTVASQIAKEKYGVTQTTLQVEDYQQMMNRCSACQQIMSPKKKPWF